MSGKRSPNTQTRYDQISQMVHAGRSHKDICKELNISSSTLWNAFKALGLEQPKKLGDRRPAAVKARHQRVCQMADEGYSSHQIAAELGLHWGTVATIARECGVQIRADALTRGLRHHNPIRIIEQIVMDAEHLTSDIGLIDFAAIRDPTQCAKWLESLRTSQRHFVAFIARLRKESLKHEQQTQVYTDRLKNPASPDQFDADPAGTGDAATAEEIICVVARFASRFE